MFDKNVIINQANEAEAELASLKILVQSLANAVDAHKANYLEALATIQTLEDRIAELTTVTLKPAMEGLVTTDPPYLDKLPYVEYAGDKFTWASCNPAPNEFDFGAIDAMLEAWPNIKFRVRIMAGVNAPAWLKTQVGVIDHVPDGPNGKPGDVPKYWNETYFSAWQAFMTALADRYEGNPQVVDIPINYTTTIFAEPFILAADLATRTRYWNAGLTKGVHEGFLLRSVDTLMRLFPTTRISLAGHGKWQYLVNGKLEASWPEERRVLNLLRASYGAHLVLDDHGLGPDDVQPPGQPSDVATSWYAYLSGLANTEQSYGLQFTLNQGSMVTAAEAGVKMGACTLEYAAFEQLRTAGIDRKIHDQLLVNAQNKP